MWADFGFKYRMKMCAENLWQTVHAGSHIKNMADEAVLAQLLNTAGYDGAPLIAKANQEDTKNKLRELTAETKALGN